MKKSSIIIAAVIIILAASFVIFMMNRDSKPSGFEVSDGNLVISGSFAITVPLAEITDLKLADAMPAITTKTNGAWLKNDCKGEFVLEGGVKARLYADIGAPPFVSFLYGDTVFYINTDTPAGSQALFDQLKAG